MIGTRNEGSLHASLKEYYQRPGDIVEGNVDGYIIDLVQKDRLVEIQTTNFGALKNKLLHLLAGHLVHLVYPIAAERYLIQIAPETGEVLGRRKSPKKGKIYDLFSELMRIPRLITNPNLTVEAVFVLDEQIRCADGQGSWRRRGVSIVDRRLLEVVEQKIFASPSDYLKVIPPALAAPFTNRELAQITKISVPAARRVTYTLRQAGLLIEVGRQGNAILYRVA